LAIGHSRSVAIDHSRSAAIVPALKRLAISYWLLVIREARPRSSTDRTEVSIFLVQLRPLSFILSNLRKLRLA
jgi:hypothetical protein